MSEQRRRRVREGGLLGIGLAVGVAVLKGEEAAERYVEEASRPVAAAVASERTAALKQEVAVALEQHRRWTLAQIAQVRSGEQARRVGPPVGGEQ